MEVKCSKHNLVLTNNPQEAPYFLCDECYKDYIKAKYPGEDIKMLTIGYGAAITPVIIINNIVTAFQGLELSDKYRQSIKNQQ